MESEQTDGLIEETLDSVAASASETIVVEASLEGVDSLPSPVETPTAGHSSDILGFPCSEEDESAVALRFDAIHSEVVAAKRTYDYMVNRLNARFMVVEGQKNKAQNETGELLHATKNLLKQISDMENNIAENPYGGTRTLKSVRGPPLPSQSDMFILAYDKGQVKTSYSQFNQRQWSSQKTQYPGNKY